MVSTAAAERGLGVRIPVSFLYLINELDHGQYTRRALPRYLHDILTVHTGRCLALASAASLPPTVPQNIDVDLRTSVGEKGGGGGEVIVTRVRRWNNRDGEVILNTCPIQRLRILSGENTRRM